MRRITIAIASTLTGLVLLFSWPTSLNRSAAASAPTADEPSTATEDSTGTSTDDPTTQDPTTQDPTTQDPATTQTYTGAAASTRYGDVIVEITVADGVLTDVSAVEYPYRDHRDQVINDYAIPILDAAALEAGSADIAMISGATVTSDAYVASLQDALDQAGL